MADRSWLQLGRYPILLGLFLAYFSINLGKNTILYFLYVSRFRNRNVEGKFLQGSAVCSDLVSGAESRLYLNGQKLESNIKTFRPGEFLNQFGAVTASNVIYIVVVCLLYTVVIADIRF